MLDDISATHLLDRVSFGIGCAARMLIFNRDKTIDLMVKDAYTRGWDNGWRVGYEEGYSIGYEASQQEG